MTECDHEFKEITVPVAGPMVEVFKVCQKCGVEKDRHIIVNPRIIKK